MQLVGDQADVLDAGVTLSDDGVDVRLLVLAKPDSLLSEAMKGAVKPAGPLVADVPLADYLIAAGGQRVFKDANKFVEAIRKSMGGAGAAGKNEQLAAAAKKQEELTRLVTRASMSLTTRAEAGKAPSLVLTLVAQVSDAAAADTALQACLAELAKVKMPTGKGEEQAAAFELAKDGELDGVTIEKVTAKGDLLLASAGEMAQMLPQLFGNEGLTLRVAVRKTDKLLVVTLGGGREAVRTAFDAIKNKATADGDAGVAAVKSHLADQANGVVYIAVDRAANAALGVISALADAKLPSLDAVKEPLVISVGVRGQAVRAAAVRFGVADQERPEIVRRTEEAVGPRVGGVKDRIRMATTRAGSPEGIPEPAVRRLSLYLRELEAFRAAERKMVNSKDLGEALGLTDAQVRKDLGYFGQFGQPGIGYQVDDLISQLRRILGTDRVWNVALIGLGQSRQGAHRVSRVPQARLSDRGGVRRGPGEGRRVAAVAGVDPRAAPARVEEDRCRKAYPPGDTGGPQRARPGGG